MNILITGGAGYIGSHVAKQLLEYGNDNITILDSLVTGRKAALDTLREIREFEFLQMDLQDFDAIRAVLNNKKFDTIIHFAASILVDESVENPLKYYMNNTVNTTHLIQCAVDNGVKKFIFSSTAATYGEPTHVPIEGINESYPTNPINPYGMSKLMSENVLKDTAQAHSDFKYVIFRYFNVAGADACQVDKSLQPRIGQASPKATHLIKIASECASQKREKMSIYGDDFDTADGTGVRDYIHVDDLAHAHVSAIDYLTEHDSETFNVGYGKGFSVKEVVEVFKEVTKQDFPVDITSRRAGDPATLIADNRKIKTQMNWQPKYDTLALICRSAYEWEKSFTKD